MLLQNLSLSYAQRKKIRQEKTKKRYGLFQTTIEYSKEVRKGLSAKKSSKFSNC